MNAIHGDRQLDINEILQRAEALEAAMLDYAGRLTRHNEQLNMLKRAKLAARLVSQLHAEREIAHMHKLEDGAYHYLESIVSGVENDIVSTYPAS